MARIVLTNEASDLANFKNAYVDTRRATSLGLTAAVTQVPIAAAIGTTTSVTATAGGTALAWITKPFLTAATIAGSVGITAWLSATSTLGGLNVNLSYYSGASETVTPFMVDLLRSGAGQTGMAQYRWIATKPVSQVFGIGDRLVVHMNAVSLGSTTSPFSGQTVTLDFDSPNEGTDGDTFLTLTEFIRVGSRQSAASGTASYVGEGRGQFQESVNKINQWMSVNIISSSATVQSALDDLSRESANN